LLSGDVETWQFISVTAEGRKTAKTREVRVIQLRIFLLGVGMIFALIIFCRKVKNSNEISLCIMEVFITHRDILKSIRHEKEAFCSEGMK